MCGICAVLGPGAAASHLVPGPCLRRGPDFSGTWCGDGAALQSAVLHMQGAGLCEQPYREGGVVLCWNGEVFGGLPVAPGRCDTAAVGEALARAETTASDRDAFAVAVRDLLEGVLGPFAFVCVAPRLGIALYGRDPLGRRSLLHRVADGRHVVASAGISGAVEVGVDGVHSVALSSQEDAPRLVPWAARHRSHPLHVPHPDPRTLRPAPPVMVAPSATGDLLHYGDSPAIRAVAAAVRRAGYPLDAAVDTDLHSALRYLAALAVAVERRVSAHGMGPEVAQRPVAVLFSGGIDCTVLAALAHFVLPPSTPIELVNVAFGDTMLAPDRQAAIASAAELRALPGARQWRLVFVDGTAAGVAETGAAVGATVAPRDTVMDHNIGTAVWFAARGVGHRVEPPAALQSRLVRRPTTSGAADLPAEQEEKPEHFEPLIEAVVQELCVGAECVDTGAGRAVLLSTLGKEHGDALRPAMDRRRCKRLRDYVEAAAEDGCVRFVGSGDVATTDSANRTVQGVALARAEDTAKVQGHHAAQDALQAAIVATREPYTAQARCVLLGMGADETLGGYVRHARVHVRGGDAALVQELERDFQRMWERNLGRDDRCVADHGREGRFPFLDEDLLAVLSTLPLRDVVDLGRPAGVGDKMILRSVARLLGLTGVSTLVKRAIQFGTRIANPRVQGSARVDAVDGSQLTNRRLE